MKMLNRHEFIKSLAVCGCRLKMGHSIVLPEEDTPLGNLWVTLLQQAGAQVDSLGSSTGILPELLA